MIKRNIRQVSLVDCRGQIVGQIIREDGVKYVIPGAVKYISIAVLLLGTFAVVFSMLCKCDKTACAVTAPASQTTKTVKIQHIPAPPTLTEAVMEQFTRTALVASSQSTCSYAFTAEREKLISLARSADIETKMKIQAWVEHWNSTLRCSGIWYKNI